MIEFDQVSKQFGGKAVVDDVSFKVAPGEFCALVGPSGSGKSTTLRMANRLIELSAGSIRIAGEDIAVLPGVSLRRRIGYVIQSVGLFPHWTIADNIATVPRLLGWPVERIRARAEELLALMQLDRGLQHQYPHQLSGGQQQRVGVARALAAAPALLLMDEPFGALDPITRQALRRELKHIHRATGTTILFVTHDMDEALDLADKIAILHDGRLEQFGAPVEILTRPATPFVRQFIGGAALGLKVLAQHRVADRLRRDVAAQGAPIAADKSLTEALSEMVLRGTDRLPVRDDSGTVIGAILLDDVIGRQ